MQDFKERLSFSEWRSLLIGALTTVAALLMFVGFRFLYEARTSEYMKEVIAGFIGAVLTITATAALIKSQSYNELRREQSVEVFKAKLSAYTSFVQDLNKITKDGKMTRVEQSQLVDWGLKLSLIAGDDVIIQLCQFLNQIVYLKKINFCDLDEKEIKSWKIFHKEMYEIEPEEIDGEYPTSFVSLGSLIQELRSDLGESKMAANDKRALMATFVDLLASSRDLSGFVVEKVDENKNSKIQ